jgi:hypothetical protein
MLAIMEPTTGEMDMPVASVGDLFALRLFVHVPGEHKTVVSSARMFKGFAESKDRPRCKKVNIFNVLLERAGIEKGQMGIATDRTKLQASLLKR